MSEAKAFDVFSAHAEVVPQQADTSIVLVCILRARGGSSPKAGATDRINCILRARGGSSPFR